MTGIVGMILGNDQKKCEMLKNPMEMQSSTNRQPTTGTTDNEHPTTASYPTLIP